MAGFRMSRVAYGRGRGPRRRRSGRGRRRACGGPRKRCRRQRSVGADRSNLARRSAIVPAHRRARSLCRGPGWRRAGASVELDHAPRTCPGRLRSRLAPVRGTRPRPGLRDRLAQREPRRRRHSAHPGVDRRSDSAVHRVSPGVAAGLASRQAGDADQHPLRQHASDPSGRLAGRGPNPAHLRRRSRSPRPSMSRGPDATFSFSRTWVATSSPRSTGSTCAGGAITLLTDGRVAERRHPLVHRRRPHRLRLDPAERHRPRHLRDGPVRSEERPSAAGGPGRRMGRDRLVAR